MLDQKIDGLIYSLETLTQAIETLCDRLGSVDTQTKSVIDTTFVE